MKVRKLIGSFVVILFCLIIFISINMKQNLDIYDTISCLDYGCYGNSYFGLSFKEDCTIKKVVSSVNNSINFAIFADYETKSDIKVRSLYFKNTYATFPMEEGRFFRPSDFNDDQRKVVIGKDLKNITFEANGKSFILLDEDEYEVIGVIGFKNKTVVDNLCFVNGNIDDNMYKFMQIDIFERDAIDYSEKIISYLQKNNLKANVISGGEKYSDYLFPKFLKSYLYIILILASFLCTVLILNHWIDTQKNEFKIRIRVGSSFKDLKKLLLFRLGLILTVVGVLSLVISAFFYFSYVGIFYKMYCFILVVSFVVFIVKIHIFKRWPVE